MIHLHTMILTGPEAPATGKASHNTDPVSRTASHSFRSALSEASSPTVAKFDADPNEGQVKPATSSTSAAVASTTPSAASSTAATSTASTSAYDPFLQAASGNTTPTTATTAKTSAPTTTTAASTSKDVSGTAAESTEAFDNSYWASQPAAVQTLRNMPESQRTEYAQQLAAEGYSIDVPIMVWGWDPSLVTSMRQADGYTWVPSAMQNPVEDAPGLGAVGNMAAYNPNVAPAGSIIVPPANSNTVS